MDIKFALVTLILPAIMEISGLLMMLHPPKTRNVLFGYRTRRSLLSQETWDFANYYGGTLYVYLGFYITAATLLTDLVLKLSKRMRTRQPQRLSFSYCCRLCVLSSRSFL